MWSGNWIRINGFSVWRFGHVEEACGLWAEIGLIGGLFVECPVVFRLAVFINCQNSNWKHVFFLNPPRVLDEGKIIVGITKRWTLEFFGIRWIYLESFWGIHEKFHEILLKFQWNSCILEGIAERWKISIIFPSVSEFTEQGESYTGEHIGHLKKPR